LDRALAAWSFIIVKIVKIKSIPGEGTFGQSQLRPQSQFAFSDMQKAFFKVLRFAAHWPSAEWN
jgi:hypothetical protein